MKALKVPIGFYQEFGLGEMVNSNFNSKFIAAMSVGVLVGAIATISVSSSSAGPTGIVA